MVEEAEVEEADGTVKLSLMRLTKEEVQWKLVAVAGSLATATAADVRSCPLGEEYSVFRIFTESGTSGQGWVVSISNLSHGSYIWLPKHVAQTKHYTRFTERNLKL